MFGIDSTQDPAIALASALTYWLFLCRDSKKSPAMGVKTWEYLQGSVKNAAIPSRNLNDFIEQLSRRLVVLSPKPQKLNFVVNSDRDLIILRGKKSQDGFEEIVEIEQDKDVLPFNGWDELLEISRIEPKEVLKQCREKPFVIVTHVRVRYERDKEFGIRNVELSSEESAEFGIELEVETNEIN